MPQDITITPDQISDYYKKLTDPRIPGYEGPDAITRIGRFPITFQPDLATIATGDPEYLEGQYDRSTRGITINEALRQHLERPGAARKLSDTIGHEQTHGLAYHVGPGIWGGNNPQDSFTDPDYFKTGNFLQRLFQRPGPEMQQVYENLHPIPGGEQLPASLFGGYEGYIHPPNPPRSELTQELMRRQAMRWVNENVTPPSAVKNLNDLLKQHLYNPNTGKYMGPK